MENVSGRVAAITGGASGIGLGFARVFGEAGMKLMLGDIEEKALASAAAELTASGFEVGTFVVDVTDAQAVDAFADATYQNFGGAHLVCNNAGVVQRHDAWGSLDDWKWVIDVDLWGVIHGVHSFVGRMREAGDEGHIVNTASTAGLLGFPGIASYVAAKHAVVGLSQSMFHELAAEKSPIGVSVLCPGIVDTNINSSHRNRPGTAEVQPAEIEGAKFTGWQEALTPEAVAEMVLNAVKTRQFWVLPHEHYGHQAIENAQGRVENADPVLPMVKR